MSDERVIEAGVVRLVDDEGNSRAELSLEEGKPTLRLEGDDGTAASIGVSPGNLPFASFTDGKGQRTSVGLDRAGRPFLRLKRGDDDTDGRHTADATVALLDDGPSLQLRLGDQLISLQFDDREAAWVGVARHGRWQAAVSVGADGPQVVLFNEAGEPATIIPERSVSLPVNFVLPPDPEQEN